MTEYIRGYCYDEGRSCIELTLCSDVETMPIIEHLFAVSTSQEPCYRFPVCLLVKDYECLAIAEIWRDATIDARERHNRLGIVLSHIDMGLSNWVKPSQYYCEKATP